MFCVNNNNNKQVMCDKDSVQAAMVKDESLFRGRPVKGGDEAAGDIDIPDLAAIKARVRELEEEAEKLKQMQAEVDKEAVDSPPMSRLNMSLEEKKAADNRSVYVGNVDYGATSEELEQHFHGCGSINRVTILCNKFDGHPKGFAYIEFGNKESVQTAMAKDETVFRGRLIKVIPKRTNNPAGLSSTNWPPRESHGAGRGTYRGGFSPHYSGYRPVRRGRFGAYFSPY